MAGRGWTWQAAAIGLAVAMGMSATARDARAQGFGIGPRMVFVTGADSPLQDPNSTSSVRLTGGFARLRASSHLGLEVSMDFRTARDAAQTIEVKSTPIQLSGLFYLLKGPVSPYAIFGAGWYKTQVDLLNPAATAPTATTTSAATTKFGYHTGFGGEVMLGKHASIYVDYRYTFVNIQGIGGILSTAASLMTGGLGSLFTTMSGANNAGNTTTPNVSHLGSMWTTGVAVYF